MERGGLGTLRGLRGANGTGFTWGRMGFGGSPNLALGVLEGAPHRAGALRQLDFIPPYGAGAYGPDRPHPVPLRSIALMLVTTCMVEDISFNSV